METYPKIPVKIVTAVKAFALSGLTLLCSLSMATDAISIESGALDVLDCVIYPSAQAEIGTGVPGIILSIPVDRSDTVDKGQVLAVLESGAERAAVELARARASAASEINFRRIGAEHSERQLSRLEQLYRNKSVSSQDLDDRKTEALLGRVQLQQARENQRILELELARAEALLERRTIRSPYQGVVVERFSTPGEFVDDQAILTIAQLDPLHVETIVASEHLKTIKAGMSATVWVESSPSERWQARVDRVDSIIDVASGTFGVRLELPNKAREIVAGLRCKLEFNADSEASAEDQKDANTPIDAAYVQQLQPKLQPESDVTLATSAQAVSNSHTEVDPPVLAAAVSGVDAPKKPLECIDTGPYADIDQANAVKEHALAQGIPLAIEKKRVPEQMGYLIKSSVLTSTEALTRYVGRIKRFGIQDYHVPKSSPPIRVSFGAFRNEDSARKLHESLSSRELDVDLIPWVRHSTGYVLAASAAVSEGPVATYGAVLCQ